jgi:hypothetical protein
MSKAIQMKVDESIEPDHVLGGTASNICSFRRQLFQL